MEPDFPPDVVLFPVVEFEFDDVVDEAGDEELCEPVVFCGVADAAGDVLADFVLGGGLLVGGAPVVLKSCGLLIPLGAVDTDVVVSAYLQLLLLFNIGDTEPVV